MTAIHIDMADKEPELPELGAEVHCGATNCPHPTYEFGYGLAGGGCGAYNYCSVCDKVVSKTADSDE